MTYLEQGVREEITRAYQGLAQERVMEAYDLLIQHIPKIAEMSVPIFSATPPDIVSNPVFTPLMGLISSCLDQLFSGIEARKIVIVLLLARRERFVAVRKEEKDGTAHEYGVDLFGPYQRIYPKKSRFRKEKLPLRIQISFGELCFYTEDPKAVYIGTYRLLDQAAAGLLGGKSRNTK